MNQKLEEITLPNQNVDSGHSDICLHRNLRLISRSNFGSFFRCTSACVWMVVTPSIPSKNSIRWTVSKRKSIGSDNKSWWSLHLDQETYFFTLEPAVAKCQNQECIVILNGGTHLMSETFTDFIGITPHASQSKNSKDIVFLCGGCAEVAIVFVTAAIRLLCVSHRTSEHRAGCMISCL